MDVEQRARDVLNEVCRERGSGTTYASAATRDTYTVIEAACRLIEQQDAFAREVSDAVKIAMQADHYIVRDALSRFILPEPVDPLVEALGMLVPVINCRDGETPAEKVARDLRVELAKRGLAITPATVDGEGAK